MENLNRGVNKIPRFIASLENHIPDRERKREIKGGVKLIKETLAFKLEITLATL